MSIQLVEDVDVIDHASATSKFPGLLTPVFGTWY